ncbi:hypothetical protein N8Q59_20115 [Enterobacter hormaechei subsp. oharae]|nr:hypothetical protein [Enterobacter hormaechei]MCU2373614.1 hypothetical protein [Enterobacter hormaechei subsp. oharae]MCU2451258.1 hypothetical protein [Enterobacter hormaechei subsp. oharae]MCU2559501.1 hypothetical protein [Enterobacter hormaechei subsp. oharae]MCU2886662.1 hypothetical protein [Enterobacter hormaechei subsp. oharae]MCU3836425.1 hypothetical protein [Enterobacter hormaechei subsp. oharae]
MGKQNNGGAAFPGFDYYRSKPLPAEAQGMTLRDYFAAKAMQGIISSECNYGAFSDLASDAYSIADAMLRAREAS